MLKLDCKHCPKKGQKREFLSQEVGRKNASPSKASRCKIGIGSTHNPTLTPLDGPPAQNSINCFKTQDTYFRGSIVSLYKSSTFFLAQGVRRRKTRLDLMPGSLLKQLIGIILPSSTQPNSATSSSKIISSVLPCMGSLLFGRDSSLLIVTCEIQCEYRSFFPSGKQTTRLQL